MLAAFNSEDHAQNHLKEFGELLLEEKVGLQSWQHRIGMINMCFFEVMPSVKNRLRSWVLLLFVCFVASFPF